MDHCINDTVSRDYGLYSVDMVARTLVSDSRFVDVQSHGVDFVYFNVQGTIRSVAVVNTRAWYFFPTGRVPVRFQNYRAGWTYPSTVLDTSDSWGAYRIEPKPAQNDVLQLYADNALLIESNVGESAQMTLEDGRRNLFWGKDFQILSEWAAEQRPTLCQVPAKADPGLMNSGVSLSTNIEPDPIEAA